MSTPRNTARAEQEMVRLCALHGVDVYRLSKDRPTSVSSAGRFEYLLVRGARPTKATALCDAFGWYMVSTTDPDLMDFIKEPTSIGWQQFDQIDVDAVLIPLIEEVT